MASDEATRGAAVSFCDVVSFAITILRRFCL